VALAGHSEARERTRRQDAVQTWVKAARTGSKP